MKSLIGCLLVFVNAVNREMCTYYFLKMHKEQADDIGIYSLEQYDGRNVYEIVW